jgi:DNA-binding winged helix-turn-helix (wHTH) protein/tetratricopeptide (TPR) repeat protein
MLTQPQRRARLSFGPFELDQQAGKLLKNGIRIRLPDQPFQILSRLVAHPGEVITREQLQEQIWGSGTFVDFEHSLNVAMNRLRRALGDSAENPTYIETIPGRGYRFIGSIQELASSESTIHTRPTRKLVVMGAVTETTPSEEKPSPAKATQTHNIRWIAIAALSTIALAVGIYFYFHRAPALTAKDTIVLSDFTNTTGDPVFDGTLQQGLEIQLEQSPFLGIVPEDRIQQILRMMGQQTNTRLTPEIAREVCVRTASAAVLDASIAKLGNEYVLGLRAKNCRTGEVIAEEQTQANRKEDVLNALSQIARKFRTKVGESLTTIEKHNTPLEEATTPSLEALKAYSAGWKAHSAGGPVSAIPFFLQAIELDPNFASAYAALGLMYGIEGQSALSADYTRKAYEMRDRTSARERFSIAAAYEGRVTGNLEKAEQTCRAWVETYPRDTWPHGNLSGYIYPAFGKFDSAVEEARQIIRLDPDFADGYFLLAANDVSLDRLDEAERTLHIADERNLETPDLLVLGYDIAFLRNDDAAMERKLTQAPENTAGQAAQGAQDLIASHQAFVSAYKGHLQEARDTMHRAVVLAQQKSHMERAGLFEAGAAIWNALFGDAVEARLSATDALSKSNDREVEYGAAFALALIGDSSGSQTLVDDLERRFPEDTSVRFSYIPSLRALLSLKHGEPAKAVELLQITTPYELGFHRSSIHGNFGALYPIYLRGEAYLAENRGAEAAAEFQKILNHRGIVISDPMGAITRLQLARTYAQMGDKTKAINAYQDFLTLWKDADAGIPILKQAQMEYAKLQSEKQR